MRIDRLELVNFRSHARTAFTLPDRTYIVGHNNAGKTTVIDALQWALTGKCAGLDEGASREIAELIRAQVRDDGVTANPQGLGVKVSIADFGTVQRQTDGRNIFLKVKDWSGSNKQQQDALYEKLQLSEAILAAVMNTGSFLRLHHAEAKALIFGVLNVRIPAEPLEQLGIAGPLSLEELEKHHKIKFDKRADAKRDLAAHQVPPLSEDLGADVPTVEDLQAQLEELRAEERELIGSTSEARGRKNAITQQIAELSAEKVVLEARIKGAGDPHAELDKAEDALCRLELEQPKPADEGPELAEDPEVEAQYQEADAIRVKLADERGHLRMISEAVDGIANHKPDKGCILDSSIPCLTPAKEFKGKLKSIKAEIEQLEKSINDQDGRLDWLNAEASAREERQRTASEQKHAAERAYQKNRAELVKKISDLNARIRNKQNDEDRLEDVLGSVARLSSDLANLADVEEPEGLAELQDRLHKGEQTIAELRAYWSAKTAHDNAEAMHAKLEERVKNLEHAVEQLGPKGLMLEVLEKARRTFEEHVNASLVQWGYRLEFQIDPWMVRVNGRKSNQLSKSERLRVGIALQLAIAEITGIWFVAIDEADMLDSKQRDIFQDVIEGWSGQVIVAATKDPDFELPTEHVDGIAVYQLALRDEVTEVHA